MRSTEACADGSCDRLSALPEGVLHTVLSFLPTRQAVQTSVLSRSWRFLWRSAPCIAIDAREFGVRACSRDQPNWGRLESFATNLLSRRSSSVSLYRFRLFAHGQEEPVGAWIRRGIECCPAVLEIATPFIAGYPTTFVFPHLGSSLYCRLKKLRLDDIELDATFTDLVSSCPALVVLELVGCFCHFWHIASATLEKLIVDSCHNSSCHGQPMAITAPSLASLELGILEGSPFCGLSECNTPSLFRAYIHIRCGEYFPEKERQMLLRSLFNVSSLELRGFDTLGMLNQNSDKFPTFPNLCNLSLERCFLDNECDVQNILEDLWNFIQNAPCLEKLTLKRCMWEANWKSITVQRHTEMTLMPEAQVGRDHI